MPTYELLSPNHSTNWSEVGQGVRNRTQNRIDALIEGDEGLLRDTLNTLKQRESELRKLLKSCDAECLKDIFRDIFDGRVRPHRMSVVPSESDIKEVLKKELLAYFDSHKDSYEKFKNWYETGKARNWDNRYLYELLLPAIGKVEKITGSELGFVPVKGGYITIIRRSGNYYALHGNDIKTAKSLEEALAGYRELTSIYQIVDKDGNILGRVETPTSRILEGLLFLDYERSKWAQIAGNLKENIEIEFNQYGHKITLQGPKSGLGGTLRQGEDRSTRLGTIRSGTAGVSYTLRNGADMIGVRIAASKADFSDESLYGSQLGYAHHLEVLPTSTFGIGLHWVGQLDLRVQGKLPKIDTARGMGEQAFLLEGYNGYLGFGRYMEWDPNVLTKDARNVDTQSRVHLGYKYGNTQFDFTGNSTMKEVGITHKGPNSSIRIRYEKRDKIERILSDQSRLEVSGVWRF